MVPDRHGYSAFYEARPESKDTSRVGR